MGGYRSTSRGGGCGLPFGLIFIVAAWPLCVGAESPAIAAANFDWEGVFQAGVEARNRGNIQLSVDLLGKARSSAASTRALTRASAELGASLLFSRRFTEAEDFLKQAYAESFTLDRARAAIDLGNLAMARKQAAQASIYYKEAESLAGDDPHTRLVAGLNRSKIVPEPERLSALQGLYQGISEVVETAPRARLYLNLGSQAKRLGARGLETAYRSTNEAYKLLPHLSDRLRLETLDAMAQLYEEQGRVREALRLTDLSLGRAGDGKGHFLEDILLRIEWRKGRLLRLEGRHRDALGAYKNAAAHLESIRQDIPIEFEDGRSSFQEMLRPVFTGLADLLLATAGDLPAHERSEAYRQAIHAMELTKQSEMQDYLGERCSVEESGNDGGAAMPQGAAVLYPILLKDRLELLLRVGSGVLRRTVKIDAAQVTRTAESLSRNLPRYQSRNYLDGAQRLYDWLLRPFEKDLVAQSIQTLVVVPDGPLRLIPMGVLHDGRRFAIEKYAVTTVTGLSMTNWQAPRKSRVVALLAGLSEPGPVVNKLPRDEVNSILGSVSGASPGEGESSDAGNRAQQVRSVRLRETPGGGDFPADAAGRIAMLKKNLSLPGVKEEIQNIRSVMPNVSIMDEAFTLGRFSQEVQSSDYRILHIASHGMFGGNASSSYIMTYDDLLTMNGLELLLKETQTDKNPIELLTLSACETAEGNERAPLGIAGAAMKAKARSVLGTLWPVGDEAARTLMERFYEGLTKRNLTKGQALQAAQRDLIRQGAMAHPFFWAPFVLIGNWM